MTPHGNGPLARASHAPRRFGAPGGAGVGGRRHPAHRHQAGHRHRHRQPCLPVGGHPLGHRPGGGAAGALRRGRGRPSRRSHACVRARQGRAPIGAGRGRRSGAGEPVDRLRGHRPAGAGWPRRGRHVVGNRRGGGDHRHRPGAHRGPHPRGAALQQRGAQGQRPALRQRPRGYRGRAGGPAAGPRRRRMGRRRCRAVRVGAGAGGRGSPDARERRGADGPRARR